MMKYQIIMRFPDIPRANVPEAFTELLEAIGFQLETFTRMPGTKVNAGYQLIQGEVVPMGHAGEATEIVFAGASAKYAPTVTLVGGQTSDKRPQYEADGVTPIMYDTGEVDENLDPIMAHLHQVEVYKGISAAAVAPFIDAYDNQEPPQPLSDAAKEAALLDGSLQLNKHAGAEPWSIVP